MFVPCPHCGFLVALIVRPDGAPQRCPRCDGLVQDEPTSPIDESNTSLESGASPETIAPGEAASIAQPLPVDATQTVANETDDDSTDLANATPSPSYEDAIAAVTAGATPTRPARRAARPSANAAGTFSERGADGSMRLFCAAPALLSKAARQSVAMSMTKRYLTSLFSIRS